MQTKNIKKISAFCLAGTLAISLNVGQAQASPYVSDQGIAGISKVINEYYERVTTELEVDFSEEYTNLAIANVQDRLNIRKEPGANKEKVGTLQKDGACEILETVEDGWVKIKSGRVTGYVDSAYLITGEEAEAKAKEVSSLVATVTGTATLRVRESDSLLSDTLALVGEGEELEVIKVLPAWIEVKIDSDEGYVSKEYVDISYQLNKAISVEELRTGETGLRADMVAFARKYLGGRYVWGGTRLGSGVDCSGFTQAIYRNFGYSIPRNSRSQGSAGRSISSSNARPGDLFFYGKGNYINHVGMYIGNGQIIHASNARSGIKISNAYYRTPIKVVRYIND